LVRPQKTGSNVNLTAKVVAKARGVEAAPTLDVKPVVAKLLGSPQIDMNILNVYTEMDD